MNSKTSFTLCSSSSFNNSQKLLSSGADLNLTEKLYLARQKLLPVIDNVMKIATENRRNKHISKSYYLTVDQYEDIVWASQILKEVDGVSINSKNDKCFKKSYNANNFNLERKHIKINKHGKIYVDTSILIQLIELHNILGDVIKHIKETPIEGNTTYDASSYTQTEDSNLCEKYPSLEKKSILSSEKLNLLINVSKKEIENISHKSNTPNELPKKKTRITKKTYHDDSELEPKLTEGIVETSTVPCDKDILIMSVHNLKTQCNRDCPGPKKNLSTLREERTSNSEIKITISNERPRSTKSTGYVKADERGSKVTNAVGARDIIVKCITDLNKIRSYFDKESVEVAVSAEIQIQRCKSSPKSETGKSASGSKHNQLNQLENRVYEVSDPIEVPVEDLLDKDGADSQLIICIKGKNEEDDVQIVIRRCSDFELDAAGKSGDKKSNVNQKPSSQHLDKNDASDTDNQGRSVTFSSSDIQANGLNILFDPDDPSRSVVKSKIRCPFLSENESSNADGKIKYSSGDIQSQIICTDKIYSEGSDGKISDSNKGSRTRRNISESGSCSRIKLYETTNLCLTTEDGQELIISLTIKPRSSKATKNLSLKDIFSESGTDLSGSKKCRGQSTQDRVIPLSRTKVCSSLQFDVAVMDTDMRKNGVQHINPNIVVRLKELGVNNLLRACRPVKCGRPAVLNETLRNCLPYSASLVSLPLEDTDADIINESLNMSLNKIKQSKIFFKEKIDKVCFTHCTHTRNTNYKKDLKIAFHKTLNQSEMHKLKVSENPVRESELNYYINLVHDVDCSMYKERSYEVRFFEIKRYNNPSKNNDNDETENQRTNLRINRPTNGTDLSGSKKCRGQSKKDRVIPLSRTKVCSSLQFDVAVMDTDMRKNGVQHINPNIVVRLKELGVNNLLRACRPVKCGRPAVLNETLRNCLPYSASLVSLPLEDTDADIINESLNMSLNKIKQSKIFFKEKIDKVCFTHCTHTRNTNYKKDLKIAFHKTLNQSEMHKLKVSENPVRESQLNYYINLVHDVDCSMYKERSYEVRFFEIKRYNNPSKNNDNDETENQRTNLRINRPTNVCKTLERKDVNQNIDLISDKNTCQMKFPVNKISSHDLKPTTNTPRSVECNTSSEHSQTTKEKRTKATSRIPVYRFNSKSTSSRKIDLECDSDIYDVSLQSLPREESNLMEAHQIKPNNNEYCQDDDKTFLQKSKLLEKGNYPPSSCSSEQTCIVTEENSEKKTANLPRGCQSPDSYELYFNNFFQSKCKSGQPIQKKISSKMIKKRKKKSQFRLSSTRSGMFRNNSKHYMRRDANIEIDQARDSERDFEGEKQLKEHKYDEENFMDIIHSVKSAFYEYYIRNAYLESKHNVLRNIKSTSSLSSCKDMMSDEDFKKIYNRVKQRIIEEITNPTTRLQSQPNVEAGMDHENMSLDIISNLKSRNINRQAAGKNLKHMDRLGRDMSPLKRNSIFPTYVKSSGSLHVNLTRGVSKSCQISERCFSEMKKILEKNKDLIYGEPNSCDHFENFIVTFGSTTSTNLTTSHRKISFEDLLNKYIKLAIQKDSFLNKGCERSTKIMETSSWLEMGMEPIKYLIYQNIVQTKDGNVTGSEPKNIEREDVKLYCRCSSPGEKMAAKPKQPKKVPKSTRAVCRVCGCYITPPKSVLSRCSTCLKKFKKGAEETWKSKMLPPLAKCSRSVKNICEKYTSTERLKQKDKACQPKSNCFCTKCINFAEDGSCFCSHCLRINDKSVDAKASNKEVAIQCICCDEDANKPETEDLNTAKSDTGNKSKGKSKNKQDKNDSSNLFVTAQSRNNNTDNSDLFETAQSNRTDNSDLFETAQSNTSR